MHGVAEDCLAECVRQAVNVEAMPRARRRESREIFMA
jgi:hypothetical protein